MSGKLQYLLRSLARWPDPARRRCLNCGGAGAIVMRKYAVTALRRCEDCALLYRTPTDPPAASARFYEADYAEGATTDLPALADLEALKASGFSGQQNDYRLFAKWLEALGVPRGGHVFDYGSSWGYGSWVLRQAGYDVTSYEISQRRARYGVDHLGVTLVEDFARFARAQEGSFDAFFSSHVLEHVPSPSQVVENALRLLKPGGLFCAIFPNGTTRYREADPESWRRLWGQVHPNFLDDVYLAQAFAGRPLLLGSPPFAFNEADRDHLASGNGIRAVGAAAPTYELFVAVRKPF